MVLSAVLVDSGKALEVVTALLKRLLADKGPSTAKEAWAATGLSLLDFAPKASPLLYNYTVLLPSMLARSTCSTAVAHI